MLSLSATPPAFADCYPAEVVNWIKGFPEPDECTAMHRRICDRVQDELMIAVARPYVAKVNTAATQEEAERLVDELISIIVRYA